MNKRQREVLARQAQAEKKTLDELKKIYKEALDAIDLQIAALMGRKDVENLQSIVYQVQYQKALREQISVILNELQLQQFKTVSDYLLECYKNGFLGAMYDLHGQGIPIVVPIAQNQVVDALTKDSKLSKTLYDSLGENVTALKQKVRQEVSRGLASGLSYDDISSGIAARMVGNYRKFSGGALYCAGRIARTEGHMIQNRAALDAQGKAKEKGADIVKQWDATLDGRTRPDHRAADGQLREFDEDFDVGGEKMPAPGIGGSAKNVVHCRCALLQRARWALDEDELATLKERAAYFGLDKTKDFDDFSEKYLKASEKPKRSMSDFDLEDVTKEYKAKATPGKGSIEYEPGYELGKHKEEISIAEWVHGTFGGDIRLLCEDKAREVKTPDYEWNGRLWELKTNSSLNAIDSSVRTGVKQIRPNPGGLIIDLRKSSLSMLNIEEIIVTIAHRLERSKSPMVDVLILIGDSDDDIMIIRYKK